MAVNQSHRSMAHRVLVCMTSLAMLWPAAVAGAQRVATTGEAAHGSPHVTINVENAPLATVLRMIAQQVGLTTMYDATLISRDRRITLHVRDIPIEDAFQQALHGTGLVAQIHAGGQVVITSGVSSVTETGTIVGTVTDANTKKPVAGAVVTVNDLHPVKTRANGSFTLMDVSVGDHTVKVRRLGYHVYATPVTVGSGETVTLTIALTTASATLSEVVTTATGERQRLEVGNQVGVIRADSVVATQQIRNLSDLLQGRLPGVVVSNTSGAVGAPSKIRLRGVNSIALNNDPIVIVDGIRINALTTRAPLQTNVGSVTALPQAATGPGLNLAPPELAPSPLDNIDPNTIEKVEVLYGPSASSLYGTDAANGVIVITTKRGQPGSVRMSLAGDAGQSHMPGGSPEMWWGWGHGGLPYSPGFYTALCGLAVDPGNGNRQGTVAAGTCAQDSVTQFNPQNDPYMQTLGTGTSQSVRGDVSGGTNAIQQFLSASAQNDVGMAVMSAAQRNLIGRLWSVPAPSWMVRPNTQQKVDLGSTTTLTPVPQLNILFTASGNYNTVLNDGNGLQGFGTAGATRADTLTYLPSESQRTRSTTVSKSGLLSASPTYRPWSWLRLAGNIGGNYSLRTLQADLSAQDCSTILLDQENVYPTACPDQHNLTTEETFAKTANGGLTATYIPFSWLVLTTAIGEQYTHLSFNSTFVGNACPLAFGSTLLTPAPVCPSSDQQQYNVGEQRDESASAGVYVEETVGLWGYYYTLGIRRDVSSAFGVATNKRPPQYPKFALSIPLSDKEFFPKQSVVSSLKLRVAYGQSGNQASQTAVLNNYNYYTFGNSSGTQSEVVVTQLGNASLRPEKSAEWEGGMDISFFENERVRTTVTMSRKFTRDLISPFTLPSSYGVSGPGGTPTQYQNVGNSVSRSLELSFDARVIDSRAVALDLVVDVTTGSDKLVHKAPGIDAFGTQQGASFHEGYPLFGFWGSPVLSYADNNHNGILEQSEIQFGPQRFMGAPYPTSTFNYAPRLALWNGALQLSATVVQVDGVTNPLCVVGCGVYPRAAVDRTAPLTEQAAYIQAVLNGGNYLAASSTVRINEASMTYAVPARVVRRLFRANALSITLAGRNLGLWSSYAGQDPNVDTSGNFGEAASNNGLGTPQPRSWVVRFSTEF